MNWKTYLSAIFEKGLTQEQLAARVGCGQSTISDIYSGKTLDPRSSIGFALWRVGRRLGIKERPNAETQRNEAKK